MSKKRNYIKQFLDGTLEADELRVPKLDTDRLITQVARAAKIEELELVWSWISPLNSIKTNNLKAQIDQRIHELSGLEAHNKETDAN